MSNKEYIYSLFSLDNKVVLITGGYGLLGRQFARAVANAGARAVIGGRNFKRAQEVATDVGGWAVELDVTKKQSVEAAVENIVNKYGTINGLINNASYSSPVEQKSENFCPFEEYSLDSWEKAVDVDVTGMFLCTQAVGKIMISDKGGVIVNVSSIYGMVSPEPEIYENVKNEEGQRFVKPAGYCVAKGAVLNFTRYAAVYWREKNVRVNSLTLGGVYDGQNESFVKAYSKRTPLKRMARSDEYNGAVLFLLSEASSYVTGTNLIIDGGWTAW